MRAYYGVCDELPETVIQRLPRATRWSYLSDSDTSDVVLIMGMDELRANWQRLDAHPGVAIVFDAAVYYASWRMASLDLSQPLGPQLRRTNTIRRVRRDPVKRLLAKTRASFIGNFITLTYKTRDPGKQSALRDRVFDALWENQLVRARKHYASNREVLALLNSVEAHSLALAVQAVRAGKTVSVASRLFKISAFDLNYLAKYMERKHGNEQ